MTKLQLAIDGNEANVEHRVGSNVFAFEVIKSLELLLRRYHHQVTILLSTPPVIDLPAERTGWRYQVIGPQQFWTQWGLPIYLWKERKKYDVFFTPGHYAPRFCPVPYVSSVMDTAYLEYPGQFTTHDRVQLRHWTAYSVKHAKKVIAISEFTKASIVAHYAIPEERIEVVYPAASEITSALTPTEKTQFFKRHAIFEPYFLFVGTIQPRKNLITLINAFEIFSRKLASNNLLSRTQTKIKPRQLPKLVLAGKVGWLADDILERIEHSPFKSRIILTGFVSETEKKALYQSASCNFLLGLYEGFGIPPLEAIQYGTIPVVANATSLPEVVGQAGYIVPAKNSKRLAEVMLEITNQSKKTKAIFRKLGREQAKKFDWQLSAQKTLAILKSVVNRPS
ncbi:MAG: hypothetical protein COY81_00400 [Candidatus Pacebacteria bacterium CG_4_10_14_0_8_um_filter_43_12]|nr:MAG: hypothetical protein COU66_03655 [Candidatus Pacebacteria bacterium CG10_big_fil_rev_8_21_14_0_10_44_11]PIY79937.1 MAG: hypothetical protein COY81_00400 [Candidatus Pacebacteria bacterium CG_4_10_14_0_8_um_filter_43_12]